MVDCRVNQNCVLVHKWKWVKIHILKSYYAFKHVEIPLKWENAQEKERKVNSRVESVVLKMGHIEFHLPNTNERQHMWLDVMPSTMRKNRVGSLATPNCGNIKKFLEVLDKITASQRYHCIYTSNAILIESDTLWAQVDIARSYIL